MVFLDKSRTAVNLVKNRGWSALFGELAFKCAPGHPLTRKLKWTGSIKSEKQFWDDLIATGGGSYREHHRERLDPDLPLQKRLAELLPASQTIHILDVGAGPLTYLGKQLPGKELFITAIDALADEYDEILRKHNIMPIIRTQRLDAERISRRFLPNTFDLCFARNCLDHAYNPEAAILQMIRVIKPDCYVLLEHFRNEGVNNGYEGLHQWNFDITSSGNFLIKSKLHETNVTSKYMSICDIYSELTQAGDGRDWIVTRIHKKR